MEIVLTQATDNELVGVLLHHLYSIYDSGGISAGRSMKSGLLEPARELIGKGSNRYRGLVGNIFGEIEFRSRCPRQIFLFTHVATSEMTDFELGATMLLGLQGLYESETDLSIYEKKILDYAISLLPESCNFQFDLKSLIYEYRTRQLDRSENEYRYMRSIGCGAWAMCHYPNHQS